MVNVSYHFCFLKQAMVNGKKCKKWSELRIELKRTLFSTLRQAKMSSGHMDSSQLLLDVVNKLCRPTDRSDAEEALEALLGTSQDMQADFATFLKENITSRPVRLHPSLAKAVTTAWTCLEAGGKTVRLPKLIQVVGEALMDSEGSMKDGWVRLAVCVGRVASETDTIPPSVAALFQNIGDLDKFLKLRIAYTLHIFKELIRGSGGLIDHIDISDTSTNNLIGPDAVSKFCDLCMDSQVMPCLFELDTQLLKTAEWIAAWVRLCKLVLGRPNASADDCKMVLADVCCEFQKSIAAASKNDLRTKQELKEEPDDIADAATHAKSLVAIGAAVERSTFTSLGEIYNALDESAQIAASGEAAPLTLRQVVDSSRVRLDALSLHSIQLHIQSTIFEHVAQWQQENDWVMESLKFEIDDLNAVSSVVFSQQEGHKLKLYFSGMISV